MTSTKATARAEDAAELPSPPHALAVLDGGMISGFRRSTPSMEQLHQAVFHLHAGHPGIRVAVVADPALKHSLPTSDLSLLDADIEVGALVMAPAGTIGGFHGFLARIVEQASTAGLDPVVITDRAIPDATLGRARLDGGRWLFDLHGTPTPAGASAAPPRARRRPRPAKS